MRRSSTDESTYRRSPSPPGKEPGFARGGPFFGLHASPGPKAAQARYTSPKGNKYVVFYLDLSFIFLLELKRCSMARGCLQGVKYLMFAFNLLFWAVIFLPKCFKSCLRRSSFTITAGRLRHPWRGHLAGGHTGQLRHPVLLLPIAVGCQPAHRHWHLRDGHRLRGLHRGHQGEQMPSAHLLRRAAAGVPARGLHHHPLLRLHGQDRQVRPAGPEEGPAPVRHPGQRGPHQRLEHHPDRLPLLRGLQLHRLVRGLQCHACA